MLIAATLLVLSLLGATETTSEVIRLCVALGTLLGMPIFFGFLIAGIAQRNRARAEGMAMYLLALIVSLSMTFSVRSYCDDEARLRAKQIVKALDAHHKQVGHYPETLDALVPQFMTETVVVPFSLLQERPYRYSRYATSDNYHLGYPKLNGEGYSYDSDSGTWGIYGRIEF